jgi:hypothetical protein
MAAWIRRRLAVKLRDMTGVSLVLMDELCGGSGQAVAEYLAQLEFLDLP